MKGFKDGKRRNVECYEGCCSSCLHTNSINPVTDGSIPSKRFITLGSIRYGVRLGAVSPPPPGVGPRYRNQCCWQYSFNPDFVSRIPLLASTAATINTGDIYKYSLRMLPDGCSSNNNISVASVTTRKRGDLRKSSRVKVSSQESPINTLDRLPRFRFGGNRNNFGKAKEARLRELTERLKEKEKSNVAPAEVAKFDFRNFQEILQEATSDDGLKEDRWDKSRRRKGMYISQWLTPSDDKGDEQEQQEEVVESPPDKEDLKLLQSVSETPQVLLYSSNSVGPGDPRPKYLIRLRESLDDSNLKYFQEAATSQPDKNCQGHHRTVSSPSKLGFIAASGAATNNGLLLEGLLGDSAEHLVTENLQQISDTRTHVVIELFETERSYVESLQILILQYLEPLKSPENVGLIDAALVDEIFFQIPALLEHHQAFVDELKDRLEHWDSKQKIGDLFVDTLSKPAVIETYVSYVNNWKRARGTIKNAMQSKPAFAKFLENTAREHKGKLALDSLLIKPIQRFPKYELLLQRLIKHTTIDHPDHNLLVAAQREVHDHLIQINCIERETVELDQLREIESVIDGLMELVTADRHYLRYDFVSLVAGGGTRKERALFLFSDLLLITSIKRKSGTLRKPAAGLPSTSTSFLEANKYKLLTRVSLDKLEIAKAKDESLKHIIVEIQNLTEDISVLNQINDLSWNLHCNHAGLDETIKDMFEKLNKQLTDQQNSDAQLSCLDLALTTATSTEHLSIEFSKPDNRASWEQSFNEAKHKLATSGDRRPPLDLIAAVPIRKTRAGLQFSCAASAIKNKRSDVWVCNSDGYVGQVCVLSLNPEPNVTSCNGVSNSRIICITLVPGVNEAVLSQICKELHGAQSKDEDSSINFDSSSSSDDDADDEEERNSDEDHFISMRKMSIRVTEDSPDDEEESTMWLGTEDGCIHIYNSNDNIRTKKNRIKIQHGSAILSIVYLENKVYVALGNGDMIIYERENSTTWNTVSPTTISVGTSAMPVSKIVPNCKKLWCGCGNTIKIFNTETLLTEKSIPINNDVNKPIHCVVLSGYALWLSLQYSATVKCLHTLSFELLFEVNVTPAVTKMLTNCDDIIRQHKTACLRVTALLACKDLLWIGTSAGVLLTMSLPQITSTTIKITKVPSVIGVFYGHTGHVRFLTNVEYQVSSGESAHNRNSYKAKSEQRNSMKLLVISGGDGYEDFHNSNSSEVAGRDDSTNHLLLWNV